MNEKIDAIISKIKALGISVKYDSIDSKTPGWKFNEYEMKGVPVRLAIGPRDFENGTVEVARRDTLEKMNVPMEGIEEYIQNLLAEIQKNIYQKAANFRDSMIRKVDNYEDFKTEIEKGGFILAHWDGTAETEARIKEETKATIRCIPFASYVGDDKEAGVDMLSGKPSKCRALFARAY
jgi:prolyl-tRNA synthetase